MIRLKHCKLYRFFSPKQLLKILKKILYKYEDRLFLLGFLYYNNFGIINYGLAIT